jgi:RNA polymerase sigma-70 factor (sigma-E family)
MSVLGERATLDRSADRQRDRRVAALFDEVYVPLRGLAYVMLGDASAAEEVVMEAFAKACSGWSRFRSLEHPHAYLRQVVVNLCRSRYRRQKVELRVNEMMHRGERSTTSDDHASRIDLWDAVRTLPDRQRACIVLRYLEDLTEAEIAETLDCSTGTVKSQLFKAKAKLERALGKDAMRGEK